MPTTKTAPAQHTRRGQPRKRTPETPFNARMLAAREAAGISSQLLAWQQAATRLSPATQRTPSYINRLEWNMPEEEADTRVIIALAKAYGVTVAELSEYHDSERRTLADLTDPLFPWNSDALRVTV
jgi:hypothetical protein